MGRNRFVRPNVVRLPLSDGDWIEVKEDIDYGEQQRLKGIINPVVDLSRNGESHVDVDWARYNLLRMEIYLIDWSFRDENDKPVPLNEAAVRALDPDTGQEIEQTLDAHVTARLAAKKANPGGIAPGPK